MIPWPVSGDNQEAHPQDKNYVARPAGCAPATRAAPVGYCPEPSRPAP